MRNQIPLAPREPGLRYTVHMVLNDFGPAYVEADEAQADKATIVENILRSG